MVHLSKPAREEAQRQVALLGLRRSQGYSDEKIATELNFESRPGLTAVKAMHQRLEDVGLPEWLVYPGDNDELGQSMGTEPLEGKGKSERTKELKGESERKAQSARDGIDLPLAARAAEMLRGQIRSSRTPAVGVNVLLPTLEDYINELDGLRERLHGNRFLSASRIEDDWESYDRTMFASEEEWKELCAEHGVDPAREKFAVSLEPYTLPLDSTVNPPPALIQLIAVYALRNVSLDPLLDTLHYDPSKVDREGLTEDVEELRHYAQRIARRVRGGTVPREGGRPDPKESWQELFAKWYCIDPLREKGWSDQEILDELNAQMLRRGEVEEEIPGELTAQKLRRNVKAFSLEDVRRLGGLKLPPPV